MPLGRFIYRACLNKFDPQLIADAERFLIYPCDVLIRRADKPAHFKKQIPSALPGNPIDDCCQNAVVTDTGQTELLPIQINLECAHMATILLALSKAGFHADISTPAAAAIRARSLAPPEKRLRSG